jgi:nucleotide-binding universal stress UspA family protein
MTAAVSSFRRPIRPIERVLVATDCASGASAVGDTAELLVSALRAALDVVTVVDSSAIVRAYDDVAFRNERVGELREVARMHAERFAGRHFTAIGERRVHVRDGDAGLEILQTARECRSDLIIMGRRRRTGVERLLGTSLSKTVLRASAVPVMTVCADGSRGGADRQSAGATAAQRINTIARILVATDCSPCAQAAAAFARQLATQLGAALEVVTVVDTSGWTDISGPPAVRRQRADQIREQVRQQAATFADRQFTGLRTVRTHARESEDIGGELIRAAAELGCDVIVLGTHGKTGLAHLVLGSVAETVVRISPLPVITVRAPGE